MSVDTDAERATYENFVTVTDDSGAITMEVPQEWDDVDGSAWVDGFGASAAADVMYEKFGITADNVVAQAEALLQL